MKEEIRELEVSNTWFEMVLVVFSQALPIQRLLKQCCVLQAVHNKPDVHYRGHPLNAVDFLPPFLILQKKMVEGEVEMPSLEQSQGGKPLGVPVFNIIRSEGCQFSVSALLLSLLQRGRTFVAFGGKLSARSARILVAPSVTLTRQVPLEILLQNLEVNTKFDKNTGALSSANYHKLPTWAVLRISTCSYLKWIYKLVI